MNSVSVIASCKVLSIGTLNDHMAGHAEVVKALLWNGITQVDGVQDALGPAFGLCPGRCSGIRADLVRR